MSVTQPDQEMNGAPDWTAYFMKRRIEQLRKMYTPEIVEEYKTDPHGARGRSKELSQILNFLRMQPLEDRIFAYAEVPFEIYRLATMHAERGVAPEVDMTVSFPNENEAIHEVFVRRLKNLGIAPEKG
jgi:branched-chain amino acid transport system permease protein